ncbi:unnamed protein product, partial [marine sediment metagenome]
EDIKQYIPATLELSLVTITVTAILGVTLGIISALRKDELIDNITRVTSMTGVATPSFWLALLLQIVFYGILGILPVRGRLSLHTMLYNPVTSITGFYFIDTLLTGNWVAFRDVLVHLILPATALSYRGIARVIRITRSSVLDVISQDYVRTARACGISERKVVYSYILKNALIPIVTIIGFI